VGRLSGGFFPDALGEAVHADAGVLVQAGCAGDYFNARFSTEVSGGQILSFCVAAKTR
jgi:hypothetical protein